MNCKKILRFVCISLVGYWNLYAICLGVLLFYDRWGSRSFTCFPCGVQFPTNTKYLPSDGGFILLAFWWGGSHYLPSIGGSQNTCLLMGGLKLLAFWWGFSNYSPSDGGSQITCFLMGVSFVILWDVRWTTEFTQHLKALQMRPPSENK